MMSCHRSNTWWEWNTNPNDIMMIWFALYATTNDVMLGMCSMLALTWQTSLINSGILKVTDMACKQAKVLQRNVLHVRPLITHLANENMSNRVLIAQLNQI